jgi:hypothetical protein
LIDRKNDPGELNDLSRDRTMSPVVAELLRIFERFLEETPSHENVALAKGRAG